MPKLHIYKNEKETCHAFAEWMAGHIGDTLSKQDRFTIALSQADTPRLLYKILSADYSDKINWSRLHIFCADEKLVSFGEENDRSNTATHACIDHVPIPKEQIHKIQANAAPEEAAKEYESLLRSYFTEPETTFDLVILGVGEQGNLLSLYPFAEENNNRDAWVIPVYDKNEDVFKISLMITAINAAAVKAFLVTGKKKEEVVQQVLKGKYEPEKYPAQLVVTASKTVHWFLDEAAATRLIKPPA